jgi:cytochrome c peroxidase
MGLLLGPSSPALATNHFTRIQQLGVGANGRSDIQFLEMKFQDSSQNQWANVTRLTFHDATGTRTGVFVIPINPPVGPLEGPPGSEGPPERFEDSQGHSALIATQQFVDATGLAADILLPAPMMSPVSGMVCFESVPGTTFPVRHCLAYGSFGGSQVSDCVEGRNECCLSETLNGPPAPAIPFMGATKSLNRFEDLFNDFECGHENSNFRLEAPTPRNAAGQTVTIQDDSLRAAGRDLFDNETFGGNGRTCATCHDALAAFGLTPQGVEERFVADPQEPLFVAENDPALAELENACLMREGNRRALILENIDGFANPPVFRGSPHLLNLALTAPYGLSGDIPDLRAFSEGAVIQHFTRTMARGSTDFRLPTSDELDALEAFMNSIVFPSDGNPDLDRMIAFAVAEHGADPVRVQRGRDLFFGPSAQCSVCHSGLVLSNADGSLGRGTGNLAFDTGVVDLPANRDDGCIGGPFDPTLPLPLEAGGNREFSTPPLVGVATTAPFFHDNSVSTLVEAVQFYDTTQFRQSPAAALLPSEVILPFADALDIAAFLEAISVDPADNCPGVPNPDQADSNGDGAGDACQPTVDVSPVGPQGEDLFAEIEIVDPNDDPLSGVVQVIGGAKAPTSIVFEALKTSCFSPVVNTDLLLNGMVIGTISGNPLDCTCTPAGGPARIQITGATIADRWNESGENMLTVRRPGENLGTLLTWAKATLEFEDRDAESFCIHHAGPGFGSLPPRDCTERVDLCRFDTSFIPVNASVTVNLSAPLITEAYSDSELPPSLDISGLEAGDYLLRATTTDGNTPEMGDEEQFTKTDEALIIINNRPPECSEAASSVDELWPPMHQLAELSIVGVTDPDLDPVAITITGVSQDEPTRGRGDGSSCPDAFGIGTDVASVRAERSGTQRNPGDGRVYHIGFTATDNRGGECSDTVRVCVPHDRGRPFLLGKERRAGARSSECVDGGPLFDSTICEDSVVRRRTR